jgi:hypothetical protein
LGAAIVWLLDSPASAKDSPDVQIMQTAASIENLAVATYTSALALPFMATVPPLVKNFMTKTKDQHAQQARAFNATVTRLGAREQSGPDPELKKLVDQKQPGLRTPADVVDVALLLENAAAQTYVEATAALNDVEARKVVGSVLGVHAQHAAVLATIKLLLATPELLVAPPPASRLPAAIGSAGFPDAFLKTERGRPLDEGALT